MASKTISSDNTRLCEAYQSLPGLRVRGGGKLHCPSNFADSCQTETELQGPQARRLAQGMSSWETQAATDKSHFKSERVAYCQRSGSRQQSETSAQQKRTINCRTAPTNGTTEGWCCPVYSKSSLQAPICVYIYKGIYTYTHICVYISICVQWVCGVWKIYGAQAGLAGGGLLAEGSQNQWKPLAAFGNHDLLWKDMVWLWIITHIYWCI